MKRENDTKIEYRLPPTFAYISYSRIHSHHYREKRKLFVPSAPAGYQDFPSNGNYVISFLLVGILYASYVCE